MPASDLIRVGKVRVSLHEIIVRDLSRAPHVVVGERERIEMHAAVDLLVPVEAAGGGLLEGGRRSAAAFLEGSEGLAQVAAGRRQRLMERNGVLHGHARA